MVRIGDCKVRMIGGYLIVRVGVRLDFEIPKMSVE